MYKIILTSLFMFYFPQLLISGKTSISNDMSSGINPSEKWELNLNLQEIKSYKAIKEYFSDNENNLYLVFREYIYLGDRYFLAFDLNKLNSKILNEKELKSYTKKSEKILENTNFNNLKITSLNNCDKLQNAGISKAENSSESGFYLTVDMCPSSKAGFEKEFFETLIKNGKNSVAISITYKWVEKHKNSFLWLLKNRKSLKISWINHSKTHYFNLKERDLNKNFMLYNVSDFENEVFDVEKMLILNGELPSIFFRFPGLVSNKELINKLVNELSLIPIGTDNWLAKSKKNIEKGEIVLVHGNLNERFGIELFNKFFNKNLDLLPLIDAFKK